MNKKANLQLIMFGIFCFLLILNISMVLRPMFSETMSSTFVGEINGQFARLTLEKDGSCDYYARAYGERIYGNYVSGIVAKESVAGAIIIYDIDNFSFNTIFAATNTATGDTIYNITAITKQAALMIGYLSCIYFGLVRDKLRHG